jgi:hypothetical protein
MGDVTYRCAKFALMSLAVVFTAICLLTLKIELDTRSEIAAALADHYMPYKVAINDREAAGFGMYENVCFDINLTDARTGRNAHRFGMVNGDDDGGAWEFHREYTSMSECKNNFNKG